jgi:hypothetical protein
VLLPAAANGEAERENGSREARVGWWWERVGRREMRLWAGAAGFRVLNNAGGFHQARWVGSADAG